MDNDQPPRFPWFPKMAQELRAQGGEENLSLADSLEALGRHFEHGPLGSCAKCLPGTPGWREKTEVRPEGDQ